MPRTAPGGRRPKGPREEWEVLATYHPGERGIRKLEKEWGAKLVCVRYRYNAKRGTRRTTVEIVVREAPWRHRRNSEVALDLRSWESDLRKAIIAAGGRWDVDHKTWLLRRRTAAKLGLEKKVRKHPPPSTTGKR